MPVAVGQVVKPARRCQRRFCEGALNSERPIDNRPQLGKLPHPNSQA
jgi:hypothetical protein